MRGMCHRVWGIVYLSLLLALLLLTAPASADSAPSDSAPTTQPSLRARNYAACKLVQLLRSQIELYQTQHNAQYPDLVARQWEPMTARTDRAGNVVPSGGIMPYLDQPAVNPVTGGSVVRDDNRGDWCYDRALGRIRLVIPEPHLDHWILAPEDYVLADPTLPVPPLPDQPADEAERTTLELADRATAFIRDQRLSATQSQISAIHKAIARYRQQQRGQNPNLIAAQWDPLLRTSTPDGVVQTTAPLGPYIDQPPVNVFTHGQRVATDASGDWHYDPVTGRIRVVIPVGDCQTAQQIPDNCVIQYLKADQYLSRLSGIMRSIERAIVALEFYEQPGSTSASPAVVQPRSDAPLDLPPDSDKARILHKALTAAAARNLPSCPTDGASQPAAIDRQWYQLHPIALTFRGPYSRIHSLIEFWDQMAPAIQISSLTLTRSSADQVALDVELGVAVQPAVDPQPRILETLRPRYAKPVRPEVYRSVTRALDSVDHVTGFLFKLSDSPITSQLQTLRQRSQAARAHLTRVQRQQADAHLLQQVAAHRALAMQPLRLGGSHAQLLATVAGSLVQQTSLDRIELRIESLARTQPALCIALHGQAQSQAAAYSLLHALAKQPNLTECRLQSLQAAAGGADSPQRFRITAKAAALADASSRQSP